MFGFLKRNLGVSIVAAFLLALVFIPIIQLVLSSFRLGHPAMQGEWTLQNYVAVYSLPLFYDALGKTLWLSAAGTVLTLTIAVFFAWLIERTDMPLRNLAWSFMLIPMAVPGVLFALAWALLLSPKTGTINILLREVFQLMGLHFSHGPLNIYSLGGLIFLDGLRGVSTVFLMIVGAFRMMDPSLEEASRVSGVGPVRTFFRVTFPVLLPAVLAAAMYSFISSMESFEAPLAVGLPANIFVLSTLIYFSVRLRIPVDYGLGAVFSFTFMFIMVFMLIAYRRAVRYAERFSTITGKGFRPRVIAIGRWRYLALAFFGVYFLLTVMAPFGILFWASLLPSYHPPSMEALRSISFVNYSTIFEDSHLLEVTWNTLLLMLIAATSTMLLALSVSWIVVRSKIRGRALLDSLMFVPHAIPGIVIGLAMIMVFLKPPFKYLGLYGTLWIVALGLIVNYIAFGTRLMNGAIVQIHKELEEAAYVSGARPMRTLFIITLPLLFPAFAAGWVWVGVHSLRAFSVPLVLATERNEVIAVSLWQYWSDGDVHLAAALGVLLMLVLVTLTLVMRRLIVNISRQAN